MMMKRLLDIHPTKEIGDANWATFLAECTKAGIPEPLARRYVQSLAPPAIAVKPCQAVVSDSPTPVQRPAPKFIPPQRPVSAQAPKPIPAAPQAPKPAPRFIPSPAPKPVTAVAPKVAAAPAAVPKVNYDEMSKSDLLAIAKKKGVAVDKKMTKTKIIALLQK